ncbi:MAG: hypothetical protein DCC55_19150 [Chloroflexi bacterium]|nr:MAG: hypothetical protein DCC55_19150 [Chloroflexota bacterium]
MNWPFLKGLQLSELFYTDVVQPILATHFPHLTYSAGLLGPGSEVLGFDDPQSMDHDWGPRLMLFLDDDEHLSYHTAIDQVLRKELPSSVHGIPTNFAVVGGDVHDSKIPEGSTVEHSVQILAVRSYFCTALQFDPFTEIGAADWISVSEQTLLSLTRGQIFFDGLGQVEPVRARLRYYLHDVWLYLLAAQWKRIAQEEAFMGRCGQVGDELGSRLVAARLVRDLMQLCFLMEQRYAPYLKWFGTAFAQLACAGELMPVLLAILGAGSWQEREQQLTVAYEFVVQQHNALRITDPQPVGVSQYYTRPFQVISGDRFVDAIRAAITSAEVLALPAHLGSVDQFIDSTDAFNHLYSGQLELNFRMQEKREL